MISDEWLLQMVEGSRTVPAASIVTHVMKAGYGFTGEEAAQDETAILVAKRIM